jgi:hypothetical protein
VGEGCLPGRWLLGVSCFISTKALHETFNKGRRCTGCPVICAIVAMAGVGLHCSRNSTVAQAFGCTQRTKASHQAFLGKKGDNVPKAGQKNHASHHACIRPQVTRSGSSLKLVSKCGGEHVVCRPWQCQLTHCQGVEVAAVTPARAISRCFQQAPAPPPPSPPCCQEPPITRAV